MHAQEIENQSPNANYCGRAWSAPCHTTITTPFSQFTYISIYLFERPKLKVLKWNEQVCLRVLMDMTKEGKIWCTIWTQTFIMCVYWICSLDSSMWSEEMTETPSDSLHRQCLCPLFSSILSLMKPDVAETSDAHANWQVREWHTIC